MECKPKKLIADFTDMAKLAEITLGTNDIIAKELKAPHSPPRDLPTGKMAVYVFFWKDQCLKVGRVGKKSQARYTSHHYNTSSSNSNLAKSVLKDKEKLGLNHLTKTSVGNWIKTETDRINFLMDIKAGVPTLSLLETFLQCRLKPRFEGFDSQK